MIVIFVPEIQQELFVPFVVNWIENPTTLPWLENMSSGGNPISFPYGPVMFIAHLPTTLLGWLADYSFGLEYFTNIGFGISLFLADILLLLLLIQTFEDLWKGLLVHYWLSPLVLFVTYWHGQTDLVPITLFFYSLTLIKRRKFTLAGVILSCSIAAKHSMMIGVPFILVYLWLRNGNHRELQKFSLFLIGGVLLFDVSFFLSDAFRIMVLENREVDKLYWLVISMGGNNLIYVAPIFYLLLLYFFWRIKKVNFDLLIAAMGVAFSIIILMTPSPPGWYLWLIPILAMHQSRYGPGAIMLVGSFSLLFITFHFLHTSGANIILFSYEFINLDILKSVKAQSIHYTLMVGFGLLIAIQILREGVRGNDYYHLGRHPLVLGIAGDYKSGKDTVAKGLALVFGEKSTVKVSGNDYRSLDVRPSMCRNLTYLNPKLNRIFDMVKDVRSLISGKIVCARSYDSQKGLFVLTKIQNSKNLILVEGLHALYTQQLLEELDVRIFVETDESLRECIHTRYGFEEKEKVTGKIVEQRRNDSDRYIKPQAEKSDVFFKLLPINKKLLKNDILLDGNTKLEVSIKNGIYYHELMRVLIGICGLQVNIKSLDEKGKVVLEINGDISSEDVNLAAFMLVPHMEEMLDMSAKFAKGIQGVVQIIILMEIDEALKRRRTA